jgi:TolA-binding protein
MNDLVASAARALRAKHDGSSPDEASTRRRILAEAALRTRRRRRTFASVWLPLAAVLIVSSAWAAVTGRVSRLVARLQGTPHATLRVETGAAPPTRSDRGIDTVETPIEAPSATPAPIATGAVAPNPPSAMGATARVSPLAPVRVDAEEALYAAAHHAHFAAHDPGAALRAWDDYLAAYPAGRFGLEARYNRGLALVRLGRMDEARAALTPFADGRSGGYRQAEARSLLDALDVGH